MIAWLLACDILSVFNLQFLVVTVDFLLPHRTMMTLKPFPSNVSITVINGNYYDEQLPSTLNKVSIM